MPSTCTSALCMMLRGNVELIVKFTHADIRALQRHLTDPFARDIEAALVRCFTVALLPTRIGSIPALVRKTNPTVVNASCSAFTTGSSLPPPSRYRWKSTTGIRSAVAISLTAAQKSIIGASARESCHWNFGPGNSRCEAGPGARLSCACALSQAMCLPCAIYS